MPNNTSITPDQLSTLFYGAELGGQGSAANHFSYAEKGQSTYSFGVAQFDVGNAPSAQKFLKDNGFSDDDIKNLSKHGGLSRAELDKLDAKLQAIPQEKVDAFTKDHLQNLVGDVDKAIDKVRALNPAAADAISKDPKLQLSIADYENQFGSVGPQLVGYLAGKQEKLQGGTIQAGDPPTREDLLKFVQNTKYGQDPHNAKAIESRTERFDHAMGTLKLGPATSEPGHAPSKTHPAQDKSDQSGDISKVQGELAQLGYKDSKGQPLEADGKLGNNTRAALEKFQTEHGLTVDGKIGPQTEKAMQTALHTQVSDMQGHLAQLGYKDHNGQALKADGIMGPNTQDALKKFQTDHGLTADGKINAQTEKAIDTALKGQTKGAAAAPSPGLDDPKNPHHAMYEQALAGVHKLDAAIGRTPDQRSAQLAAAVTVDAVNKGLTRIDAVAISEDGTKTFAADNSSAIRKLAEVPTVQGLNTPMQQSSAAVEAATQAQAKTQVQSQAQSQMQAQPAQAQPQPAAAMAR
ncbi:peptidoglycan-binding protein [Dyella sp.]|uniref:peptidoglycan-binding protein n=1 Tax=Dyella sp. TaxID=1869338 RepID=UPI002ED09A9F